MKRIKISELKPEELSDSQETIALESQGEVIGYYHPICPKKDMAESWEGLNQALEKVSVELGIDKETLINALDTSKPFPSNLFPVKS
jgi:hypothetical protein